MNLKGLSRFAGRVPQPFAVYQPPILNGGLAFEVGICSYEVPDLAAFKTVEEYGAAIQSMKDRLNEIQAQFGVQPLDDDARAEWAAIDQTIKDAEVAKAEAEARLARIADLDRSPSHREDGASRYSAPQVVARRTPDNLYDIAEYRRRTSSQDAMTSLMVDGAMRAVEGWVFPHPAATEKGTSEHIQKLLSAPRSEHSIENGWDSGKFAEHLLKTGSPEYARAFGKAIAGLPLTPQEQATIATVGTTTTGGYAVPPQLDPTIILTSDGQVNPLRQISTVRQLNVGNTLQLITSAGVSASYGTETAARTPTSPTLGRPAITVVEGSVVIDFSYAAGEDIPNLSAQLAPLIQDAKDALEAEKFVNGQGSGSDEPEGVLAGIATTYNVGTTGDGFDTEDLGRITTRLGDRWEPRARWLAHRAIYTEAERLDRAAGGGSVYRPLAAGEPANLLGYPRHNSSAMESDFTTDGNRIAIFGDFGQFVIVDKIGLTVELVPHMVDTNGKLVGRGLLARFRNSSAVVVDSAFRVLTVGVVTS
ncbi:MAG TPA: phage major capsid protein [Candidatus Limnocylindrales bacterium]|nr:phage major capsid protein [Candidatus Limnocylindrales bacterium]